uniref:[FeFe] hydrogenase H-cluster maturation GTPase HydF n=1 Tax=Agathobacter sp. TaxID=2021311 RepID=UPI0040565EA7
MGGLNETPSAERLHIGVFGKTNSGKSSFINAITGQEVSIVSEVKGTTTDLVHKAMEISPLGPCVWMDTAGFDDETVLGEARKEKTRQASEKADIAVIVAEAGADIQEEVKWHTYFRQKNTPVLFVVNKADKALEEAKKTAEIIQEETKETVLLVSAKTKAGMEQVKEALARKMPNDFAAQQITGNLVRESDVVLLVMPQDIQAPKGRLILPQVQTIRELLDKKCIVMSITTDKMAEALKALKQPPKLVITDSQVFKTVYELKPKESMLTSFSVLFAAYKGDLPYYAEGAKQIDALTEDSKVLIAECCTHAPLSEDIGRVKIPNMLRKRFGAGISIDMVSGMDFPKDLSEYDLIIQCGGCMFNRKYIMSRIETAKRQQIPMTNYGVAIAHLTGILEKISIFYQRNV